MHVVFLHGVRGLEPAEHWLAPVNASLRAQGMPTLDAAVDELVLPDYSDLFDTTQAAEPPETTPRVSARELTAQRLQYWARQAALERAIRPHTDAAEARGVPTSLDWLTHPVAELAEFLQYEPVTRYVTQRAVRNAVWGRVLATLPTSGSAVVVAHSLGSVVAAGLLRRLPPELTVELLVTIGSPLGMPRYRAGLDPLVSAFPYEQVRRWVNVHGVLDLVTAGRGASAAIPSALDVVVRTGTAHSVQAYMSHPVVAAAIGSVVFARVSGPATSALPARAMHRAWYPLLLSTAYTLQVAQAYPSGEWAHRLRLEAARDEIARRVVGDIATRKVEVGAVAPDHPLAEGRHPSLHDLTAGGAGLVHGEWSDAELLPLAVGLMLQPLVSPFDVRVGLRQRADALAATLALVRASPDAGQDEPHVPDQAIGDAVHKAIEWAEGRMEDGRFPWGTVLITSGVVLLAATGIGLAAAAPAGLAGAAVVSSTLAAFGPGGMVGGLVTLGVLTGTASASVGFGAALEMRAGDPGDPAAAAVVNRTAGDLVALDPDPLAVTLTAMLAVLHAQAAVRSTSTAVFVRAVVSSASDRVRAEWSLHEQIAPGSAGTKQWRKKITLLERCTAALDLLTSLPDVQALVLARTAAETGRLAATLLERAALPGSASDAG